MELPINHKDLSTIVRALALGGDTRLYFVLKNVMDDNKMKNDEKSHFSKDPNVKVFSESDEYQCLHNNCDI